jgi:hypothetical protein
MSLVSGCMFNPRITLLPTTNLNHICRCPTKPAGLRLKKLWCMPNQAKLQQNNLGSLDRKQQLTHIIPKFEGLWIFAETFHKFSRIYMPPPPSSSKASCTYIDLPLVLPRCCFTAFPTLRSSDLVDVVAELQERSRRLSVFLEYLSLTLFCFYALGSTIFLVHLFSYMFRQDGMIIQ